MKYLKTYEELKQPQGYVILPQEIIDDLHDICLELQDMNFTINILGMDNFKIQYNPTKGNYTYLIISKWIPSENGGKIVLFHFSEIEDVIERIKDYMNIKGYNCVFAGGKFPVDQVNQFVIYFRKNEQSQ